MGRRKRWRRLLLLLLRRDFIERPLPCPLRAGRAWRRLLLHLDGHLLLTCIILEGVLHPFFHYLWEELLALTDMAKNRPRMRDQLVWWVLEHHTDGVLAPCFLRHVTMARDLELQELSCGRA